MQMGFGSRLLEAREAMAWSRAELAQKSKVASATIQAIEVRDSDRTQFKEALVKAFPSDTTAPSILLQIESAVFKDDNKWRFNDGATSFFAEIADVDFLARINSGDERFGKGDVLIVDLQRIQTVTDNGLKLEYVVQKVRDHKKPLQMNIGG